MGFRVRSDFKKGMLDDELERIVDDAADAWVKKSSERIPDHWKLHRNLRQEKAGKLKRRVIADPTGMGGEAYAAHQNYGARYTRPLAFWEPGEKAAEDSIRRAKIR